MAAILQVALMLFSGMVLFSLVFTGMGGLAGMEEGFASVPHLLRIGGYSQPGVPAGIYLLGMCLMVVSYPLIHQIVAQRILARISQCAVERRFLLAGAKPARQLSLQPVAVGAVHRGNDMD